MRFVAIVRPKVPIPPEQLGGVLEGFAQWRERYRDNLEVFEFFAGGGGGFGICDVPDVETLNQLMVDNPINFFSDVEIRPTISGDVALKQWQGAAAMMMAGAPS